MREAILSPGARTYSDEMSDAERAAIDRRIARLEDNPIPDQRTTFAAPSIPGFFLYDDEVWRLSYATPNDAALATRSIAHVLDLPS
jgi:hypothetical protein